MFVVYLQLKEEKEAANEATSSVAAAGNDTAAKSSSVLTRSESEPEKPAERRASRYEAPKRDEEAETNRKIKAKRARETRRSTQVGLLSFEFAES